MRIEITSSLSASCFPRLIFHNYHSDTQLLFSEFMRADRRVSRAIGKPTSKGWPIIPFGKGAIRKGMWRTQARVALNACCSYPGINSLLITRRQSTDWRHETSPMIRRSVFAAPKGRCQHDGLEHHLLASWSLPDNSIGTPSHHSH